MKHWSTAGVLLCLGMMGCSSMGHDSETRPVGKPVLSAAELEDSKSEVSFSRHVKPILETRCLHCHSGATPAGTFSLETRREALETGVRGPRIDPGNPDGSLLTSVVSTLNHELTMPAVGMAVPDEEIGVLIRWIEQGAVWPDGPEGTLRARER